MQGGLCGRAGFRKNGRSEGRTRRAVLRVTMAGTAMDAGQALELARDEVARLADASTGGQRDLLRRCALAVLTSGSASDDPRAVALDPRTGEILRGAILAVPMTMLVLIIMENFEGTRPIAVLMRYTGEKDEREKKITIDIRNSRFIQIYNTTNI